QHREHIGAVVAALVSPLRRYRLAGLRLVQVDHEQPGWAAGYADVVGRGRPAHADAGRVGCGALFPPAMTVRAGTTSRAFGFAMQRRPLVAGPDREHIPAPVGSIQ